MISHTELVLLVLSRPFAGAAQVFGGAEHPWTPLAVEGALEIPEEAERDGEVSVSVEAYPKQCIKNTHCMDLLLLFSYRLNTNAMGLLNLLTAYQKKHLVEFLPYHECDTQSRQAPDLECLIKLQAQHTQQRHLIFLTGIVISVLLLPLPFMFLS